MCLSKYNVIVIGSGAAGIMAAIRAKENNNTVLLLEQQSKIAPKLKATGGGRCNLSNTLDIDEFMSHFGKNGRFMTQALKLFDREKLTQFFANIGAETHCPDGFRIFPKTHNSQTIIDGLVLYMQNIGVEIKCNQKVLDVEVDNNTKYLTTTNNQYSCDNLIIATGGLGYEPLGASGDGFKFAQKLGHKVTKLYPAMMPLNTQETWVAKCTAHTIPKAIITIDIKKHKLKAIGDLIFTKNGIRGPVVLDFAREIIPLFDKYDKIPVKINMLKGKSEDDIIRFFKDEAIKNPNKTILEHLEKILPKPIIEQLANIVQVDTTIKYKELKGIKKVEFIKILCNTPLTITGHDGFKKAMITRGGISLKQINPNTMQSKIIKGVYFCGEIVDIDGPCGGYNLQWAFSSGYLSGELLSK